MRLCALCGNPSMKVWGGGLRKVEIEKKWGFDGKMFGPYDEFHGYHVIVLGAVTRERFGIVEEEMTITDFLLRMK